MEEKDLSTNTFELEMDGGLIPQKSRGSLAKETAEGVSPDVSRRI
jgi:hypothetical protein